VKEPGTRKATPWHNDHSYWQLKGNQVISLWLALDHVPKSSCVKYVKGSHKWQLLHKYVLNKCSLDIPNPVYFQILLLYSSSRVFLEITGNFIVLDLESFALLLGFVYTVAFCVKQQVFILCMQY
jgi:hypothetical protein